MLGKGLWCRRGLRVVGKSCFLQSKAKSTSRRSRYSAEGCDDDWFDFGVMNCTFWEDVISTLYRDCNIIVLR